MRRIAGKGSGSSSRRFSHRPRQPESNSESQQRELERLHEEFGRAGQKNCRTAEADSGSSRNKLARKRNRLARKRNRLLIWNQLALRKQNSTNSSKPPSSDGLADEPRRRGRSKKSRRKPSGQRGHQGAHRPLVSAERVDEICHILPEQCQRCGKALPAELERAQTVGAPQRHQVTELPAVGAHVTEYQLHCVACEKCIASTRAVLPRELQGNFGPHLTALVAYLTVVCRMPRRLVEALLEQVLGMSLGSTQKCWEEASQAVALPYRSWKSTVCNGEKSASGTAVLPAS
jgi:hypothetical protein